MSVDRDRHWPWLGFALGEALRLGLTRPDDVLQYATPEVLVSQLPHELVAQLLEKSLTTGKISAQVVLEVAPANVLAEQLEPEIVWRCLDDIAALSELSLDDGSPRPEGRRWLTAVLERALSTKFVTPADLLRFLPPASFVRDAPLPVLAELIRVGVTKGQFNPDLVVEHLTPQVIGENLKTALVWRCLADAAMRHFELDGGGKTSVAAAPAAPAPKANGAPAPAPLPGTSTVISSAPPPNGGNKPPTAPPGAPPAAPKKDQTGTHPIRVAPPPKP
jgi:hypothetical protein